MKDGKSNPVATNTFENLSAFLEVHAKEKLKLDASLREKRAGLERLEQEIQVAEQNLNDHSGRINQQMW